MRYVKSAVFVGAAGALVFMTAISCAFGLILPKLLPKFYTGVIAMILFLFFGFKLLYEW
jgi:putative Ca2+/H+ antiporter (TMEM165/GDT1 family)